MDKFIQYLKNFGIGLDVFVNAILGGSPKQTMSSRVYIYKDTNKVAYIVYRILNWIQPNHCENAFRYDNLGANNNDGVLK